MSEQPDAMNLGSVSQKPTVPMCVFPLLGWVSCAHSSDLGLTFLPHRPLQLLFSLDPLSLWKARKIN